VEIVQAHLDLLFAHLFAVVFVAFVIEAAGLPFPSRILLLVAVNKRIDRQINYGSGKDVSAETIADAKRPLKLQWYGGFVEAGARGAPYRITGAPLDVQSQRFGRSGRRRTERSARRRDFVRSVVYSRSQRRHALARNSRRGTSATLVGSIASP